MDDYKQNIYKMKLHECLNYDTLGFVVTRVASGWVYDFVSCNGYKGGIVFVPFDNAFQGNVNG